MLIIVLSAASILISAFGIFRYSRIKYDTLAKPFGQLILGLYLLFWFGISFVPALGAAGLVLAHYAELNGMTRLIGLAPASLVLLAILSAFAFVICHLRPHS